MAQRGKPLDVATLLAVRRALETMGIRRAARLHQISRNTLRKYLRPAQPDQSRPIQEQEAPGLLEV